MELDWRGRVILEKLAEGQTYGEAAVAAGMTRQGVWWRMDAHPDFRQAVERAREVGRDERAFRRWLAHPFRGRRPPTGKGHGGKPRFTYGRR